MLVKDCYCFDIIKAKGKIWSLGCMVDFIPGAVQAFEIEAPRLTKESIEEQGIPKIFLLSLEQDVEEVVSAGLKSDDIQVIMSVLASLEEGIYVPLGMELERQKELDQDKEFIPGPEDENLINQLKQKVISMGWGSIIKSV